MQRFGALTLSVFGGEAPPAEFRIFSSGTIDTIKGAFTFDAAAAAKVMAAYAEHGIDLMVDYDHASLSTSASRDPAEAGKAAAWFGLEVRNGELWAVNVRWTPAAEEALRGKEWRFMSPAFLSDREGRITKLLNVALTNLPATRRLDPLIAASATALGATMDLELVKKALDALVSGDSDAAAGILKDFIASAAAGGEASKEAAPAAPAEASAAPTEAAAAPPAPAVEPEKKDDEKAVAASVSWLLRETGKTTLSASVDEIKAWKASHLQHEANVQKLADERKALEADERRRLYAELVTLGGRAPSTVWADADAKAPKNYLAKMSLDELREHVTEAKLTAPKPAKLPKDDGAGEGAKTFSTPHGAVTLSASELEACAETGAKPEIYAANKAFLAHKRK
jgi:phage I-like protein